jgi:cell division septal protein FtsQ
MRSLDQSANHPTRTEPVPVQRLRLVLGVLVGLCLGLAVIVWWQLLSATP